MQMTGQRTWRSALFAILYAHFAVVSPAGGAFDSLGYSLSIANAAGPAATVNPHFVSMSDSNGDCEPATTEQHALTCCGFALPVEIDNLPTAALPLSSLMIHGEDRSVGHDPSSISRPPIAH